MRTLDALIVGGGPAGSAAAITLARAGEAPLLLERNREAGDALCGGFLSWRTLETLQALGIEPDSLNRERITRVRIIAGDRVAEATLPRPAISVSRRRLDALLLDQAAALGAAVERGVSVRSIRDAVRLDDGSLFAPKALFLASGKHEVRGLGRPSGARGEDPALGLRVRAATHPALDRLVGDSIELHLFDRGYAGVVRQEDGSANICLAVRRSRLHEVGDPATLLAGIGREAPQLGDRLAFARSGADAVANVPYGWRDEESHPGLFRLGDQAGVIPSLAGEGMGIALASGVSAARAYLREGAMSDWQPRFALRLRRPIGIADAVRGAAEHPPLAARLLPALRHAPALVRIIAQATRISVERG